MSSMYEFAKAEIARQNLNLLVVDLRVVLIDTGTYVFSSAHKYYSELSGVVGAESGVLVNKSISDAGVFDADDTVLPLASGVDAEALVVFVDTGDPLTDILWLYIDSATGLPVLPNGTDIDVIWNVSGITKF